MQAHSQTSGSSAAIRHEARLAVWGLAWLGTLALASFGPTYLWDSEPAASWIAIAANVAIGFGLIFAHARYLQGLDELQRKIMLDAMALTLGVGGVAGFAYVTVSTADLIAADAEFGYFLGLMAVVYVVACVVGTVRYR